MIIGAGGGNGRQFDGKWTRGDLQVKRLEPEWKCVLAKARWA